MTETPDEPLFGLLTDIVEGVAALSERVDAIEARMGAQSDFTNEALATIAEIATRTYYASKPPNSLPDDVINANVLGAMIERWPRDAVISMSTHDAQLMRELGKHSIESIERMLLLAKENPDQSNATRLRTVFYLAQLIREKDKRAKAKVQRAERDPPGRSR